MPKNKLNILHDLQLLSNIRFKRHHALARHLMNGIYKTTLALSKVKPPLVRDTVKITREHADPLTCYVYYEDGTFFKPLILYFHGGGFQMEGTVIHQQMFESFAKHVPATVFAVNYRLLPEYQYPAPHEDAIDALNYVLANQKTLGYTHIYVAGDSAGGNLALGLTMWARDQKITAIKKTLLIYPVLTKSHTLASHHMYDDTPMWNQTLNTQMWSSYIKGQDDVTYADVLNHTMDHLPPIHLETAQFDPLRDEGILLEKKLKKAGSKVTAYHTMNTVHGYDALQSASITKQMMKKRIAFFKENI